MNIFVELPSRLWASSKGRNSVRREKVQCAVVSQHWKQLCASLWVSQGKFSR